MSLKKTEVLIIKKIFKKIGKVLIILLGIGFIYFGCRNYVLKIIGKETSATYTTSRIGGHSDNMGNLAEYKWSVSYKFYVGKKEYTGSQIIRGSSYNVELPDKIRYLAVNPNINYIIVKGSSDDFLIVVVGVIIILINVVDVNKKFKKGRIKTLMC